MNRFRHSSVSRHRLFVFLLAASTTASVSLIAQEANPTTPQRPDAASDRPVNTPDNVPVYKIRVVARDIPAVNYFHRNGSTKIGFQGTSLLPGARGEAKVESKLGRTVVDADIRGLSPANGFGDEYLTYVMWAITPEGRPINLGEVLPSGGKEGSHMTLTTNLQAFGLIVTAEPYYAVTMPSDIVVMQNFVLEDKTQGVIEPIVAHYSLLPRGAYAETAGRHSVLHPITRNERSPLELYEAENAVQIAQAGGADKYAADTMTTAKTALQNAQDLDMKSKGDRKETITYAREAVQAAEDARIITIRKIKEEDDAATRQARLDAEQARAAAQQAQATAEQEAQAQAQQRAQADTAAAEAEARAKAAREAQRQAEMSAQQAQQTAQTAAQQAAEARERLRAQLNQVLQTTETARGLIVNMSDVLFDFNKYTLKPEAREKLAKVSGILLAYPGLKTQVEGYTDNIGSEEYNQKLSEQRADGVKDYLVSQSVAEANVTAQGFGKTHFVADNSTNDGRAKNRRVELVVSGAAIGIDPSQPGDSSQVQPQAQPGTQPAPGAAYQQPQPAPGTSGTSNPPQR
jgi:outer membrane protein OmpA-like peptidoglycan-associated protein